MYQIICSFIHYFICSIILIWNRYYCYTHLHLEKLKLREVKECNEEHLGCWIFIYWSKYKILLFFHCWEMERGWWVVKPDIG